MEINVLEVAPLDVNCVLINDDSGNLVIIDPGGDFEQISQYIETGRLTPRMILLTHGHFDHIGAVHDLHIKYGAPVSIHKSDEPLLQKGNDSARYFGFPEFPLPKADSYLTDGQEIAFGSSVIKVLHTPGHTVGGVCFYIPGLNTVITGDTLFREGIGRTDFPGGSMSEISDSITRKLYSLNSDVIVYPGHGSVTSIGYEKKYNPYVHGGINAK